MANLETLSDLFAEFKLDDRFVEHRCCLCENVCALTVRSSLIKEGDLICASCAEIYDYLRGVLGIWDYLHNSQGTAINANTTNGQTEAFNIKRDLFDRLELKYDARIYAETRVDE